eukprot:6205636-Pleurochrysis_carterae.AAC.6
MSRSWKNSLRTTSASTAQTNTHRCSSTLECANRKWQRASDVRFNMTCASTAAGRLSRRRTAS